MSKLDVILFFDRCADQWDADVYPDDELINGILDAAGMKDGLSVLDVGCGTGALFGLYAERGITDLTGIDISPKMVKIAKRKYPGVKVLCGDVEDYPIFRTFDRIMVFNAFPHFFDPDALLDRLTSLLKDGGRLTIAHDAPAEEINARHVGRIVERVSNGLMPAEELAELMGGYLTVDTVVSDDEKYIVSGTKN